MNFKKFTEVVNFFMEELECDERCARKLAGYTDNIVFNAGQDDNDNFIWLVAFGLRNAYWEGKTAGRLKEIFHDADWD